VLRFQRERAARQGRLRVTAPVSFGVHALAPAIADYLTVYPEVEIALAVNDRIVDLIEEGYEIAIRVGVLGDSGLIARPARSGLGIILQPEVLLAEDISSGRLVPIVREYAPPSRPMQVVYLPDRRSTPELRTFIDFITARFGER